MVKGGKQMADQSAEEKKIEEVIDRYYRALTERKIELLDDVMAHDSDMVTFGTDRDERWVGWKELREIHQRQFEAITSYEIHGDNRTVRLNAAENTSWFSETMKTHIDSRGKSYDLELRMTGVLEKREGEWKIVHFHRSMPKEGFTVDYLDTHGVMF